MEIERVKQNIARYGKQIESLTKQKADADTVLANFMTSNPDYDGVAEEGEIVRPF